jgi:predicted nucleotidyltransferase
MDRRKLRHLNMLRNVARQLADKRDMVVFVGGAVAGLFFTDPAAAEVRPTADVDLVADVLTRTEYYNLEAMLRDLGFTHSPEDKIICRWRLGELLVDLMPPDKEILGSSSNRWYRGAIRTSEKVDIGDGIKIRLVTPPYFIATKLEAFLDRGKNDFLASHDLEDVIAVIDSRAEIVDDIVSSDTDVKEYISSLIREFLSNRYFMEALPGKLQGDAASQARLPIIVERLNAIAGF